MGMFGTILLLGADHFNYWAFASDLISFEGYYWNFFGWLTGSYLAWVWA